MPKGTPATAPEQFGVVAGWTVEESGGKGGRRGNANLYQAGRGGNQRFATAYSERHAAGRQH